ncbi:MAG: DUF6702 family protein [Gemmatimonadaceae bacterium]
MVGEPFDAAARGAHARRRRWSGAKRARRAQAILATMLVCAFPAQAHAHAIHSTLTEISLLGGGRVVVRIRTFADDFSTAVARVTRTPPKPGLAVGEAEASTYVGATVSLAGRDGRPVPLRLQSIHRTGDVVWLELVCELPTLTGAKVRNAMLFDVHRDQVNVVKAVYEGRSYTTLFSLGDQAKALP